MPKTYMPPAISELASRAPPAIARYQLRLKRLKGRIAWIVLASICFILMPLKNASGSQISEQMRCQKLSRTESAETNASTLSNQVFFAWAGSWRGRDLKMGAGAGHGVSPTERVLG